MTDERIEKLRELAEKAAVILHDCDRKQVNCTTSEYCNRDRAYIADMIEQEVCAPLLSLYDSQQQRIEELKGQLRWVDEVLSRRPALADLPDRGAKIEKAISVASSADRWKSRCESAENGRDAAEARVSRAEQALKEAQPYCDSLRKKIEDQRGSLDHRALVIGGLTKRAEAAESALSTERERVIQLEDALRTIAGFAVGNGDVCEIIAQRARRALSSLPTPPQQEQK